MRAAGSTWRPISPSTNSLSIGRLLPTRWLERRGRRVRELSVNRPGPSGERRRLTLTTVVLLLCQAPPPFRSRRCSLRRPPRRSLRRPPKRLMTTCHCRCHGCGALLLEVVDGRRERASIPVICGADDRRAIVHAIVLVVMHHVGIRARRPRAPIRPNGVEPTAPRKPFTNTSSTARVKACPALRGVSPARRAIRVRVSG